MKIDRSGPELIVLIKSYMEHFNEIPPVFSDDIPEHALIEMLKKALSCNQALPDGDKW